MRIVLLLALSSALTGSLFLIQDTIVQLNHFSGGGILTRSHAYDTTVQKLDQLVRAYATAKGFNGSVLVARGGTILLDKGYGWRDAARKLPNDGRTRFQIASTTKTFTSTMILRLAEEGKLALTDKLSRWYPQLPFADSVTIEQMLTHTSGIYDFTREPPIDRADEQTFIRIFMTHPLDFLPGSDWRYSNSNYVLLGFIVGKLTGEDYFQAVRKQLFEPLHMQNSGFDFIHLDEKDKAIGYKTLDDTTAIPDIITDSSVPAGAGSIYSTVEDLYRWHQGLEEGKVLSKAWQKKAYQRFQGNGYGYGWTVDEMTGHLIVSHSGAISGFGSDLERVPEAGASLRASSCQWQGRSSVCVVVLSNKSGSTSDVQELSHSLLAILYDQPYSLPKNWTILHLSTEQLQTYTGLYEFPQIGLNFRVWVEDGALHVQSANRPGPVSIMLPTGNDHFVSHEGGGGDVECWFDRKAGTLTFTQRGQTFTGQKSQ